MTASELSADRARRDLYDIMQADEAFDVKARKALDLGQRYLGVENAHLTRIHPEADYWEAIASTDPPDGDFPAGLVLDYNTTYCRHVLAGDDSVALHDAHEQGWSDDPAVETHELSCYHGTPVHVDGEPYGTVCFVSSGPRETPFDEDDTLFAELTARLIEHELERQRHEAETTKRSNSITVLSRVLRHNLRNEMTVVRGHISALAEEFDDGAVSQDLFDSIDHVISLSDKARKLESVILTDYDHERVALEPLLDRIKTAVEVDYPDAEIDVDAPEALSADLMPSFELAVTELVENAADHGGPDASVVVRAEATDDGMKLEVSDDGPGLPRQEQAVLSEGVETSLVHGSGLGLWMVYWIVTRHDGTIEAARTDDGTTVTVRVPRVSADESTTDREVPSLQRGMDRFEAVFEESFDAMIILDDDRRIIDANEHAADLLTLSKSDLLGRSMREFAADEFDVDAAWDTLQAEGVLEGRFPMRRPDGDELVVEFSATADILPGQHLFVGRDITGRIERERELEETTQRLELALEGANTGIWSWDPATDEVTWNESMERLFGLEPGTFEGTFEAFADRVHPEDLPDVEAAIETALETDGRGEVEYRIRRDDGEQRWVEARGELFERGDSRRFLGVVVDVTDRKEREAALRTRTRAMEHAPIGITLTDPSQPDNPMVYANERFCELTGYDEADVLGRNCRFLQGEATDPDTISRLRAGIDAEEPVSEVVLNYRADGTPFWNHVTIAPIEDETGAVTNYVGFQQDVTDRVERERQLELAETVFENTQDALLLVDVDDGEFVVERVNEVYEALTGRTNEAIAGKTPREILGPDVGGAIEDRLRECVERQAPVQYVEEVPVDGEPRRWQTKLTPITDDGTVEKLVGAMRDVTGE